jgi:hypothetical protein
MRASRIFIVIAMLITGGWVIVKFRYALTPDSIIALQIRDTVGQADNVEDVKEILEHRFQVLVAGIGEGYFKKGACFLETANPEFRFFHIVVARYGIIFDTYVEAQVVTDKNGRLRDIAIRRTTDAL